MVAIFATGQDFRVTLVARTINSIGLKGHNRLNRSGVASGIRSCAYLELDSYRTFSSMGFYESNHKSMVFLEHYQEGHLMAKLHARQEFVAVSVGLVRMQ